MKLVKQAITGDDKAFNDAINEIGNRIDGKALATIEYTGELSVTDLTDAQLDQRLRDLNDK